MVTVCLSVWTSVYSISFRNTGLAKPKSSSPYARQFFTSLQYSQVLGGWCERKRKALYVEYPESIAQQDPIGLNHALPYANHNQWEILFLGFGVVAPAFSFRLRFATTGHDAEILVMRVSQAPR